MPSLTQLLCKQASFSYGARTILRDITLTAAPGDRIGIVGANGTGKTTLLRLLNGELEAEAGSVTVNPPDATVGLLRQQVDDLTEETAARFIIRKTGIGEVIADFEASVVALAEGGADANESYDRALTRYLWTEAATFDERSERTLADVGLRGLDTSRLMSQLSGGQRTKVNLAAMLLASFDVLLLDEPTNDLDVAGLEQLEAMVLSQERAMVIVSHDRAFLERVITSVYELDDHEHTGTRFNGGFVAWQAERDVRRQQHYDDYAEYNDKRSRLQDRARTQQQWSNAGVKQAKGDKSEKDKFIRAHRIATSEKVAGKAKQTERALERLERNEKVEAPWEPWELRLEFAPAERSSQDVAVLHRAIVERDEFRLGPIDASVVAGDRIIVTGNNGSGKTTLLQALLGRLSLTSGTHALGPSVKIAELRQGRELFIDAASLLRGFTDVVGCEDHVARSQLAKLGLDTERINRPLGELSPGEQTRAALGVFAAQGSNLLVLDEPTNHLDLPAIEQLEAALEVFPHTVLLVTHDRRLIETASTNRHWHLENGKLSER